jgi:hypothetical protein
MKYLVMLLWMVMPMMISAQELEDFADGIREETEDDGFIQQMEHYRKHPLHLNNADEEALRQFGMLSALQVQHFISYRKFFGRLTSIYELQAVPSWDIDLIRKMLPFMTLEDEVLRREELKERLLKGDHVLVIRFAYGIGSDVDSNYIGDPSKSFLRYRYQFKNLLQYGLTCDKDAGERFFDFYSFHFFTRKAGWVRSLALGDFTVNMGQGLVQWQRLAFKKSAQTMTVRRQSEIILPYTSAGEYNFHRGIGVTMGKGKFSWTTFLSMRQLSANKDVDANDSTYFISSVLTTGYHRTEREREDKHVLQQISAGASIQYKSARWHIGVNGIHFKYSLPVRKRDEPYNYYAFSGDRWRNYSVDYSYTHQNMHLFGEMAIDQHFNKAMINGLLLSVDPTTDVSILYRKISPAYQAINANAFTENTAPANENGCYIGASVRATAAMRIDAYVDVFSFPWLKHAVSAPSRGRDVLLQLTYTPDKKTEIYTRFKNERRGENLPANQGTVHYIIPVVKQNWRTQINFKINMVWSLRSRVEMLWYNNKRQAGGEQGFLYFFDLFYKHPSRPLSVNGRIQYFESDGFESRMYAYENDVLYYFSIPSFAGKGFRYYINTNYGLSKRVGCWVKWSGSELKLLIRVNF